MSTCDACKWWNAPRLYRDGMNADGELWTYELGQCMCNRFRKIYPNRRPSQPGLSVSDDAFVNLDHANLMTGPKFGCIYHEAK